MTALAAIWLLAVAAAPAAPTGCTLPFGPGEHFVYRIEYLGLTAGTVEITLGRLTEVGGKRTLPVVCTAHTESAFALYPVHDKFVSTLDVDAMQTEQDVLEGAEGSRSWRQRMRFDQAAHQLRVRREGEARGAEELTLPLAAGAVDVAGLFFAMRAQPLAPGATRSIPVSTDTRGFTMTATVGAPEPFDGDGQAARPVLPVSMSTNFAGKLEVKKDMRVLYTQDERRLPLRADADFLLGQVSAILVEHQAGVPLSRRCDP